MKKIIFVLVLVLSGFVLMAQGKGKKFDIQDIKNDTIYYYGESAVFDNEEDAIKASIENLYLTE